MYIDQDVNQVSRVLASVASSGGRRHVSCACWVVVYRIITGTVRLHFGRGIQLGWTDVMNSSLKCSKNGL
jgi:hypothetical protein